MEASTEEQGKTKDTPALLRPCPICRDDKESKRLLPCGHGICASCILRLHLHAESSALARVARGQKPVSTKSQSEQDPKASSSSSSLYLSLSPPIHCPMCNQAVVVPNGDPLSFPELEVRSLSSPESAAGLDMAIKAKGKEPAFACAFDGCKNPADVECFHGCGFLCRECFVYHQKAPFTKFHRTRRIAADVYEDERISNTCSRHGGHPLEYYCKICVQAPFLCLKCAYEDASHSSSHIPFSECLKWVDEGMEDICTKGQKRIEILDALISGVKGSIEQVEDNFENVRTQIRNKILDYHKKIDKMEEKLILKTEKLEVSIMKPLELDLEDLYSIRSQIELGLELYQEAWRIQQQHGALTRFPYAREVLQSGLERPTPTTPTSGMIEQAVFHPTRQLPIHLEDETPKSKSHKKQRTRRHAGRTETADDNEDEEGDEDGSSKESPVDKDESDAHKEEEEEEEDKEEEEDNDEDDEDLWTGWVYTQSREAEQRVDLRSIGAMSSKVGGLLNGFGPLQFHYPWGMAVHPKSGHVYVVDKNNHRIQVLTADLAFVSSFGSQGAGVNQFYYPRGITITGSGLILVADMNNHRVQMFERDFVHVGTLGSGTGEAGGVGGSGEGQLNSPYNTAVDPLGNIYVADLGNKRVQKFTRDGRFVCAFGAKGGPAVEEVGQAQALACLPNEQLAVLAHGAASLKLFTLAGRFVRAIPIAKLGGYCNLLRGPDNSLFISDAANHRVMVYDLDGRQIRVFGAKGSADGQFNGPTGMAIGLDRRLYVNDCDNNRLQVFDLPAIKNQ